MFRICVLLAASSAMFASVQETIDPTSPLEVSFSTTAHNRIAVEGGSIEKVFGDGAFFSVTLDPITGQAFVHLLQEIEEHPAMLSVITSDGLVQDLAVTSRLGIGEIVLLKEASSLEPMRTRGSLTASIDILHRALAGKLPDGYIEREVADRISLPEPLEISSAKSFEGPFEEISLYSIVNNGDLPVVLSPDALKAGVRSQAFVSLRELKSGEEAFCLIATPKDEGAL